MQNIISLAIPFFLLFMGIEILYSRINNKGYYELKDSMSNLGIGILSQLAGVAGKVLALILYALIYEFLYADNTFVQSFYSMDITTLRGFLSWTFAFVLADFCYYWFHRHSHQVNLFWAFHVVHHSSEEYNLSVALRQSGLGFVVSVLYKSGGAFVGIPPEMFFACYAINLLYQFWIHTKLINKMGVFELLFNTPSHHRVHHSRQTKYLDRNYAGVFIIWDRMFGTFIEEEDEIVYGIYPRGTTYNSIRVNTDPLVELVSYFIRAKGIGDKFKVLFSSPLWLYENYKRGEKPKYKSQNFEHNVKLTTFLLFVLALGGSIFLLFSKSKLDLQVWLLFLVGFLSLFYFVGSILDKRKGA